MSEKPVVFDVITSKKEEVEQKFVITKIFEGPFKKIVTLEEGESVNKKTNINEKNMGFEEEYPQFKDSVISGRFILVTVMERIRERDKLRVKEAWQEFLDANDITPKKNEDTIKKFEERLGL